MILFTITKHKIRKIFSWFTMMARAWWWCCHRTGWSQSKLRINWRGRTWLWPYNIWYLKGQFYLQWKTVLTKVLKFKWKQILYSTLKDEDAKLPYFKDFKHHFANLKLKMLQQVWIFISTSVSFKILQWLYKNKKRSFFCEKTGFYLYFINIENYTFGKQHFFHRFITF